MELKLDKHVNEDGEYKKGSGWADCWSGDIRGN